MNRLLFLAIFFTFAVLFCSCRDVYVAQSGNDGSGDGSKLNPFATVRYEHIQIMIMQRNLQVSQAQKVVEFRTK
jgi:hypothetical protein